MSVRPWRGRALRVLAAVAVLAVAFVLGRTLLWPDGPSGPEGPTSGSDGAGGSDGPGMAGTGPEDGDGTGPRDRSEAEAAVRDIVDAALRDFRTFADEPEFATSIAQGIEALDDDGLRTRILDNVLAEQFAPDEAILPEGARLVARSETWERIGRAALIDVLVVEEDGTTEPYRMTLLLDGEDWRILGARWLG